MLITYRVVAAVRTKIRRQGDSGAEAEKHAQRIHGDVDNGDAELLDEGRGQEVEQGEEPPDTHEERVVDDRRHSGVCAGDVVAHQRCYDDGADQLGILLVKSYLRS